MGAKIKGVIKVALATFLVLLCFEKFGFTGKRSQITTMSDTRGKVAPPNQQYELSKRTENVVAMNSVAQQSEQQQQLILMQSQKAPQSLVKIHETIVVPTVRGDHVDSIQYHAPTAIVATTSGNSYGRHQMPYRNDLNWKDYLQLPRRSLNNSNSFTSIPLNPKFHPLLCSEDIVQSLKLPRLTKSQQEWCAWALDPKGGKVVVGKSWGLLNTKSQKEDFDLYNCNAFSKGYNPSCDDAWGDESIKKWSSAVHKNIQCPSTASSQVKCMDNDNNDRHCVFENVQINFGLQKDVPRPKLRTPTRNFQNGFFSIDCKGKMSNDYFPFAHLYKNELHSQKCNFVLNGTVLLYSHDDITNLGHTMNDIMNVWVMLWVNKAARHAKSITFLNADSFKLGHNHHDALTCPFYATYNQTFQIMLKGSDFGSSSVCIQNVLLQPIPPKFFIWDSWFTDNDCSMRGPSSLFQRYNMHIRHNFGLLHDDNMHFTNQKIRVLLLNRNQQVNLWGSSQTSRNTINVEETEKTMREKLAEAYPDAIFETISLEGVPYEKQMKIVSEATILIGMHGAGMVHGVHMSIGTKYCCGVIEIFPAGYYTPIRGHGNVMRRTGLKYDRVDILNEQSFQHGAVIPVGALVLKTLEMLKAIAQAPTCVLPTVYNDPFMEKIFSQ